MVMAESLGFSQAVIGSNVLNILCLLGAAALTRPFEMQSLRPLDVGVPVGSSVLLLPLMWRGSVLTHHLHLPRAKPKL